MSNSWWFSAFRQNGGPTWYGDNRTPVITDVTTVKIAVIFGIFLVAFLVIFPGLRRARWTSFLSITLALVVGALIVVCIYHPCWHVGELRIVAPYKAFASERLRATLGIKVGLKYVNITLKGAPENNIHQHLYYNERFTFYEVKSMQNDLHDGLRKGMPYPILSVIEYLSVDKAGFIWGRRYRLAGYYTCILLWLSFALWLLHLLMLCLIPQFYSRTLICLGVCIILADMVFLLSCPKTLYIPFADSQAESQLLSFELSWCFWTSLTAGIVCFIFGATIRLLESKALCKFSTFLQVDFDELYDNAAQLNTTVIDERQPAGNNYQERVIGLPAPSHVTDPGPALAQGKDQFVEVDEPAPKQKTSKSGSDLGGFRALKRWSSNEGLRNSGRNSSEIGAKKLSATKKVARSKSFAFPLTKNPQQSSGNSAHRMVAATQWLEQKNRMENDDEIVVDLADNDLQQPCTSTSSAAAATVAASAAVVLGSDLGDVSNISPKSRCRLQVIEEN